MDVAGEEGDAVLIGAAKFRDPGDERGVLKETEQVFGLRGTFFGGDGEVEDIITKTKPIHIDEDRLPDNPLRLQTMEGVSHLVGETICGLGVFRQRSIRAELDPWKYPLFTF